MKKAKIREPHRVLVIVLQRIGDVLLATPIARSLKEQWPSVQIDFLVAEGTEGILSPGDGIIDQVISVKRNSGVGATLRLLSRIFRQYDLALSTQSGDRSIFYTLLAARWRASMVPSKKPFLDWKRAVSSAWVEDDKLDRHVVLQNALLMDAIGVKPVRDVVVPTSLDVATSTNENVERRKYVVIHPGAKFPYKEWTKEGWIKVISGLVTSGLDVVLSGGPDTAEKRYCELLCREDYPGPGTVINRAGQTSFPDLAQCLSKAALYIGVDTSVTHLAAATGVAVLSIYGPTNPVKWAPWPKGYEQDFPPFQSYTKAPQTVGNVTLLQGDNAKACVPCHLEGCDRHPQSRSQCLDRLDPQTVLDKALTILVGVNRS